MYTRHLVAAWPIYYILYSGRRRRRRNMCAIRARAFTTYTAAAKRRGGCVFYMTFVRVIFEGNWSVYSSREEKKKRVNEDRKVRSLSLSLSRKNNVCRTRTHSCAIGLRGASISYVVELCSRVLYRGLSLSLSYKGRGSRILLEKLYRFFDSLIMLLYIYIRYAIYHLQIYNYFS